MKKRICCAVLAAVLALCLAGCGRQQPDPEDGRLQVVSSLFPYYDFVRAIGGEHVNSILLVPAGRETHSFEPTPLDVITVSKADVFVYNGGESEFWVEEILGSAGENISTVVRMMDHVDALEEEIDQIDELLAQRKKLAEQEDKMAEIAQLEAQIARISADPTRQKEALQLQQKCRPVCHVF